MTLGRITAVAGLLLLASCIDFPDAKGYAGETPACQQDCPCQKISDCASGQSCAEGVCVELGPLSADKPHYGKTLGEWAVVWAQWWLSLPDEHDANPMIDVAGGLCAVGQPDTKVFMLTQAFFDNSTVLRTCDAVAGEATFLPLYWWLNDNQGTEPENRLSELELQTDVSNSADAVETLTLEIDDKAFPQLRVFRIHPQRFSFTEDTALPWNTPTPDQTSFVDGAYIDGFFVLLPPLPSGEHTLHYGSTNADTTIMDTTYHMVIP